MAISPDIQRAIEIIDQRISSLVKIKEMLLKEFGINERAAAGIAETRRKTRKETLIDFLKSNGPAVWRDILAKTGMPRGTLASLLADKSTFKQDEDGKWDVMK